MYFLDNATLWVGISFILFVVLTFKPIMNATNNALENKIKLIKKKN